MDGGWGLSLVQDDSALPLRMFLVQLVLSSGLHHLVNNRVFFSVFARSLSPGNCKGRPGIHNAFCML